MRGNEPVLGDLRIVTFDTSAHNRLVDDGLQSEAVIAGLRSRLFFRFAGLSIEEMVACADSAKRNPLFTCCARIQEGRTDCIYPHNELLRRLIVDHSRNPAGFDWMTVNVRAWDIERAIKRRELIGDEQLSAERRIEQSERAKQYKKMFWGLRPKIEKVFNAHGEHPPTTFRQAIARLQNSEPNLIWGMGKLLYDRATGTEACEASIREFMDVCPPFRALIYAMLMSWYDISVRDRHTGERFRAGRTDLFMSVYLAYCDQFVTAEVRGEQEKCLREVAAVANLESEVLSYDNFHDSFLITV